jgi:hypothetical protein
MFICETVFDSPKTDAPSHESLNAGEHELAKTANISMGGLAIRTLETVRLGEKFRLEFVLPNIVQLGIEGEVVWADIQTVCPKPTLGLYCLRGPTSIFLLALGKLRTRYMKAHRWERWAFLFSLIRPVRKSEQGSLARSCGAGPCHANTSPFRWVERPCVTDMGDAGLF